MKFSIITCTYNSEKNIAKTLDSILDQNFQDYEILIIDGKSTDKTLDIVKNYELKFQNKLKCFSEKDGGVYDGMNKGIKLAKGEWIYFLNSGDYFNNSKILTKIFEFKKDKNLDVIYGNIKVEELGVVVGGKFDCEKLLKSNISHQALFFKKSVFNIIGLYNLKYKTLADWVFNMQWFNNEKIKKAYIDLVIANYELNGLSRRIYDETFYSDFRENVISFFPEKCWRSLSFLNKLVYTLFKIEFFWRFWKIKNEIIFKLKNKLFFKKLR